jgi:hypothetical protein
MNADQSNPEWESAKGIAAQNGPSLHKMKMTVERLQTEPQ